MSMCNTSHGSDSILLMSAHLLWVKLRINTHLLQLNPLLVWNCSWLAASTVHTCHIKARSGQFAAQHPELPPGVQHSSFLLGYLSVISPMNLTLIRVVLIFNTLCKQAGIVDGSHLLFTPLPWPYMLHYCGHNEIIAKALILLS